MIIEQTFANAPHSVGQARRYARGLLDGVAPDVVDAVATMVSELATNCIRHAATHYTVSIDRRPNEVRVAVTDAGPGLPTVQSPTPATPSGRGLQIVTTFADDWGVTPSHDTPGKTVWFTVELERSRRERTSSSTSP